MVALANLIIAKLNELLHEHSIAILFQTSVKFGGLLSRFHEICKIRILINKEKLKVIKE